MSLPARQQRVLNQIEDALRVSEPGLAAMYGMFARLSAGEPVAAETLARARLRRGTAACVVLIPVVFAVIIVGALLGGSARGATTCGIRPSAARGAPLVSRALCPAAQKTTQVKNPAPREPAGQAVRETP
jgi:hypothetical protein